MSNFYYTFCGELEYYRYAFIPVDVEIEKLEKRKARYQERSPSPITNSSANLTQMPTPLPSLSLPSVSPMAARFAGSKEKIRFMNELGLTNVSLEHKQGKHCLEAEV